MCWKTPSKLTPFFPISPFLFWRGEIIFIVVYWILVWKRIKYVWTATAVLRIYKHYFIALCRSDNINMSIYVSLSGMQVPLRDLWVFSSLILSKLTELLCYKNEVRKTSSSVCLLVKTFSREKWQKCFLLFMIFRN